MIKVNLESATGFTDKELVILNRAIVLLEKVLNTSVFTTLWLKEPMIETNGNSQREMLTELFSGESHYSPSDGVLDFKFTMYQQWWSRVIGYVIPGRWMIYVNRRFFLNPVSVASNMLHEYMHTLGYDHKSAQDYQSVPYSANRVFERACKALGISG